MQLLQLNRTNMLRQHELAKRIGVSVQTIIQWEVEGMPVHYRETGIVFYDVKAVSRWLNTGRKKHGRRGAWRGNRSVENE